MKDNGQGHNFVKWYLFILDLVLALKGVEDWGKCNFQITVNAFFSFLAKNSFVKYAYYITQYLLYLTDPV